MKPLLFIITGLLLSCGNVLAQDTIIDFEFNEISSKVIEITENEIKYRKWENLDGPIYSFSKGKVLMVIYQNGQREIFRNVPNESSNGAIKEIENRILDTQTPLPVHTTPINSFENESSMEKTKRKVRYLPHRINVGLEPLHAGVDTEFRIIRNAFNLGFGYLYYFPEELNVVSSQYANIYGSLYLPINLILKNYEKQDKGLFPFVHLGYGASQMVLENDFIGATESYLTHGFVWKFGFDYLLTRSVGVTLTSYEAKSTVFGLVFSF